MSNDNSGSDRPTTGSGITVIIPVAKDGPRGGKPTWMLTHPEGHPILVDVLKPLGLSKVDRIIIVTKREHIEKFCRQGDLGVIRRSILAHLPADLEGRLEFHILRRETDSAPATIVTVIDECDINGPIFIKDGDGAFAHNVEPLNYVVGLQLRPGLKGVDDLPSKSYLQHSNGFLSNIQEKKMISDIICVGGYGFASSKEYRAAYEAARKHAKQAEAHGGEPYRLFNSHIVHHLLLRQERVFVVKFTDSFEDWKSDQAWRTYLAKHRNIIVALEGVLFGHKAGGSGGALSPPPSPPFPPMDAKSGAVPPADQQHPVSGSTCSEGGNADDSIGYTSPLFSTDYYHPIQQNIHYIQTVYVPGRTRVIVTTHRSKEDAAFVEELLNSHEVPYDDILYGLMRCTTVMIAPYGEALQHPSAVSYCVPEGSAQLGSVLHLQ